MLGSDPIFTERKDLKAPSRQAQETAVNDGLAQGFDSPQTSPAVGGQGIAQGDSEAILMVDDEEPVRKLAVAMLEKYGYRVLQAANGEEALDVWKLHRSSISLLVTDMVMPGDLSGWELAQQLLDVQPLLKVVYTSGYSAQMAAEVFEIADEIIFLQKPYLPETLAETVRVALDLPGPSISQEVK